MPTTDEIRELKLKKNEIVDLIFAGKDLIGDVREDPQGFLRERKDDLIEYYGLIRETVEDVITDEVVKDIMSHVQETVQDATDSDGKFNWWRLGGGLLFLTVLGALLFWPW